MLTPMTTAAALVHDCRHSAQLSIRELADEAGVAASTVTRIEAGRLNPTLSMLRTILRAAGQELTLGVNPTERSPRPQLRDLSDAWRMGPDGEEPDWTRLRGFLDYLSRRPDAMPTAIRRRPPRAGSPVMDALLAGIAEKIAQDRGLEPPPWTRHVPALEKEYTGTPGTPRMVEQWRRETPSQLRRRGLVIDEQSLWRDEELTGV